MAKLKYVTKTGETVLLATVNGSSEVPDVPIATETTPGLVYPDNNTIIVDETGKISIKPKEELPEEPEETGSGETLKYIQGNVWISNLYEYVPSTQIIVNHNLNLENPRLLYCEALLQCIADEYGYKSGEFAQFSTRATATYDQAYNTQPRLTTNTIAVTIGASGLRIIHKTNGNPQTPTDTNWRIVFRIFY